MIELNIFMQWLKIISWEYNKTIYFEVLGIINTINWVISLNEDRRLERKGRHFNIFRLAHKSFKD